MALVHLRGLPPLKHTLKLSVQLPPVAVVGSPACQATGDQEENIVSLSIMLSSLPCEAFENFFPRFPLQLIAMAALQFHPLASCPLRP